MVVNFSKADKLLAALEWLAAGFVGGLIASAIEPAGLAGWRFAIAVVACLLLFGAGVITILRD